MVPTHYVLFTLSSIVGPSILYRELTLDADYLPYPPATMLTLFILGIALTFGGVAIITAPKPKTKRPVRASLVGADRERYGSMKDALRDGQEPPMPDALELRPLPETSSERQRSASLTGRSRARSDSLNAAGGERRRSRSSSLTSSFGALGMSNAFALANHGSGRSQEDIEEEGEAVEAEPESGVIETAAA